jgi:hypothetical protein
LEAGRLKMWGPFALFGALPILCELVFSVRTAVHRKLKWNSMHSGSTETNPNEICGQCVRLVHFCYRNDRRGVDRSNAYSRSHPRHRLAWIFVAMFNLLRLRNGGSIKGLTIVCIAANLTESILEVYRMTSSQRPIIVVAVPILCETVFSIVRSRRPRLATAA